MNIRCFNGPASTHVGMPIFRLPDACMTTMSEHGVWSRQAGYGLKVRVDVDLTRRSMT